MCNIPAELSLQQTRLCPSKLANIRAIKFSKVKTGSDVSVSLTSRLQSLVTLRCEYSVLFWNIFTFIKYQRPLLHCVYLVSLCPRPFDCCSGAIISVKFASLCRSRMCSAFRYHGTGFCSNLEALLQNFEKRLLVPSSMYVRPFIIGFFIDIKSSRSYHGPGVDSACNRNEYQEHFVGVKSAGA